MWEPAVPATMIENALGTHGSSELVPRTTVAGRNAQSAGSLAAQPTARARAAPAAAASAV